MAVLRPLKVVITNFPEDETDWLDAVNNQGDESAGTRKCRSRANCTSSERTSWKTRRAGSTGIAPGREVRLRYGYFIKCEEVVKDESGEVVELRCTYDTETRGGSAPDGRRVRATLHWVSTAARYRRRGALYDHLFTRWNRTKTTKMARIGLSFLNPESLVVADAKLEPSLSDATPGSRYQFERQGYFCVDTKDSTPDRIVFNRTATLRDTWARVRRAQGQG